MNNLKYYIIAVFLILLISVFFILKGIGLKDNVYFFSKNIADTKKSHLEVVRFANNNLRGYTCLGKRFIPGRDNVKVETLTVICNKVAVFDKELVGWDDQDFSEKKDE